MNFCVQDFMWYVFSSLKTLHFVELLAHRVTISAKGFSGGSGGKASACSAGDLGSIPRLGRSPGEGKGYPLQYSGLENSMDHTVAKSQTRLSDLHFSLSQHSCRKGAPPY